MRDASRELCEPFNWLLLIVMENWTNCSSARWPPSLDQWHVNSYLPLGRGDPRSGRMPSKCHLISGDSFGIGIAVSIPTVTCRDLQDCQCRGRPCAILSIFCRSGVKGQVTRLLEPGDVSLGLAEWERGACQAEKGEVPAEGTTCAKVCYMKEQAYSGKKEIANLGEGRCGNVAGD